MQFLDTECAIILILFSSFDEGSYESSDTVNKKHKEKISKREGFWEMITIKRHPKTDGQNSPN